MIRLLSCLLLCSFASTQIARAQSKTYRITIDLSTGTTQYNGELGNDFFQLSTINSFSQLGFSHYVDHRFDIRLGMVFGSLGYTSGISNAFDVDFFNVNMDVKWKIRKREDPKYAPYVFAGMGVNQFSNLILLNQFKEEISYDVDGRHLPKDEIQSLQPMLSAGVGIQFQFAERIFLFLEERMLFPHTDALDGIQRNTSDNMLRHTIGINFGLSSEKESVKLPAE